MNYSNYKILIVEDSLIQRTQIEIILKKEGFNTKAADNGKKALELLQNDKNWEPEIVITDINMPKMNGLELCRNIVNINKNIRTIVLTADTDRSALENAFLAGAVDFIKKPIEKLELLARIKNTLEVIVSENVLKNTLKQLEEQNKLLEKLSTEDSLTGLLNRRVFFEKLSERMYEATRQTWPLTLFMFDVDNFKGINDKNGHLAGDEALKEIGSVLKNKTRRTDYACRYGGDEFIILLTNTKINQAVEVVNKIKDKILNIKFRSAPDLKITISGGLYQYIDEKTEECFIEKADILLYEAKQNGKNQIKF